MHLVKSTTLSLTTLIFTTSHISYYTSQHGLATLATASDTSLHLTVYTTSTSQHLTTLVLVCNWGDMLNKTVCISNFYSFSHILPSHLTAHNTTHYLTKPNDTLQHLSAPCNNSQYLATPHNTSQNLTTLVLVCKIGVTYFPIIVGVGLNTDQKIISFSLSFYGLRI